MCAQRRLRSAWAFSQSDQSLRTGEDQPGHPPRLIRVFAVRIKKAWVLSYPWSAQRRLWSDWADAQADLSLRWAHGHFVGFVMRRLILFSCWPQLGGILRFHVSPAEHKCPHLVYPSVVVNPSCLNVLQKLYSRNLLASSGSSLCSVTETRILSGGSNGWLAGQFYLTLISMSWLITWGHHYSGMKTHFTKQSWWDQPHLVGIIAVSWRTVRIMVT